MATKRAKHNFRFRTGMIAIATASLTVAIVASAMSTQRTAQADQGQNLARPFPSLSRIPVPEPRNLSYFVANRQAAVQLGKALFWDEQLGSDGIQACASCHFHSGADNRSKNQIDPDFLEVDGNGNSIADYTYAAGGPNYQLTPAAFPYHRLSDITNRNSTVTFDTTDVTSSQGIHGLFFGNIVPGQAVEVTYPAVDYWFNINGIGTRRVPPRHTPSAINAVFNYRNFWDGRAQNDFNGVDEYGFRDTSAQVVSSPDPNHPTLVPVSLDNSSLASQALDPPMDVFEMDAFGRTFLNVGQKMLSLHPLAQQYVHPFDSVLGPISNWPVKGIRPSYRDLIKIAFRPAWWQSNRVITLDSNGNPVFSTTPGTPRNANEYDQMQYNFTLFFGLAIQMYEETLVSDQTPFDRYLDGNDRALTDQQKEGFELFQTKGQCIQCHGGTELTNASVSYINSHNILETIKLVDGSTAVHDTGFENTGVRPTYNDLNLGRTDPYNNSFSDTRMVQAGTLSDPQFPASSINEVAVDGAFKIPGLRNVALHAPYFNDGGELTLHDVVDFYNRGGDRQDTNPGDTSAYGANLTNVNSLIHPLGLTAQEENAIVAFLESLTDPRVQYEQAPFDHPEILLPNGHPGDQFSVTADSNGLATDSFEDLPAVGAWGGQAIPLFLGVQQ